MCIHIEPAISICTYIGQYKFILPLNSNVVPPVIVTVSSPDESLYAIDDKLTAWAVIAPVKLEVDVISMVLPLINPSVA